MDNFQLAIVVMAVTDTQWGRRDAHGRRREFTAEELDAIADFGWHWADVKGRMAACANAIFTRLRPRASNRIEPTLLPSAEATSQV
ncbi:MAG: hypothetical protein ACRDJC_17390 [Thermomicrobiales bacterium]